ncbi:o-succinylbenzoate--CoA ligase, partial [Salmonella enterica subsp. enterica serovar Weltevreden]|nr:o-succinylbenzoate--CoA ligase [Salmonella enterica subsp. enterica serovar Weltevreden]
ALMECGARFLRVTPQLAQTLLEELLPKLTVRFALTLEGENGFSGLTALQIQKSTGAYAVAWQPQGLVSMRLTSGSTVLPKA